MKRLLLFVLLVSCTPNEDQATGSIQQQDVREARKEMSPRMAMHLDSGNAAYRAQDFDTALRHFRAATNIDENAAAGWFGIYMTQLAKNNAPAADSALKKAQELAPGASILRK